MTNNVGYTPITLRNNNTSTYQPMTLGGNNTNYAPITLSNNSSSALSFPQRNQQSGLSLVSVVNNNRQQIQNASNPGALSSKEDIEAQKQVKEIICQVTNSITASRETIDVAISKFYEQATKLNEKCVTYVDTIYVQMNSGANVSQVQVDNLNFLIQVSTQIGNRFFDVANQLVTVQKLNTEGKLGDFRGVIDLIFYARIEEVKVLEKRYDLLQKQSKFELELMIAVQNQVLKSEAQAFDEYLKVAEFSSKEAQAEHERNLDIRKQKHSEEVNLEGLAIQRFEVESKQKIEETKVRNEKEIAEKKIKSDHDLNMARIRAEERVQWVKTITSVAKPNCIIM